MHSITVAGVSIPALGFGTWEVEGDNARRMVAAALDIGYRHIDTAKIYGNEKQVGEGIRESGVPRDQIFLTTKIWNDAHKAGDLQAAAEASLERLGVDHVDLLLVHWPVPGVPLAETMTAMNDVLNRGLSRSIGVSNFPSALVEEAVRLSKAPLATNQVEYHPYLSQAKLAKALTAKGISLTAYSPLARGRILDDAVLGEIAKAHGKTVSQVAIRWLLQQPEVIVIPKTMSEARARENFETFDFELTADEMARIFALARPDGRVTDGPWAPKWD
jgi:diketogulonate reductase-like aldo/keto reductase